MGTVACTTCTHPVPDGARFCPSCGTSVTKSDGVLEERRVVTVLFADLVGYTALAEHLDPERVKRLVESCFERLVADIDTFGGRVDKLLGDGIVALFGAPVAHEDDAERAVRAGLRMQDTLARFVEDTGADPPIRMRVGLNTGEVLFGTLAGSDYTAMGDVVNTASRLQALAPPGGVLAGSATAALCPPSIHREPFGITRLRGRNQDEQSWLVTGADPAGVRPLRCDVPFVGRVHERELLAAALQLVRNGHSGVVSIIGEAGSGKSRLADELVVPLEGEAIVVRTACAPYGDTNVWAPVVTGLASLFGIDADASADEVARVVRARARELWGLDDDDPALLRFLDVVGFLLGHPSPLGRLDAAGARDAVQVTLTDMVRRHAQTKMTVLVVDNLQWAEPSLRDQLGVIVRTLSELPFLLVTTQRPDGGVVWSPPVERPLVLQLPLGPLSRTTRWRSCAASSTRPAASTPTARSATSSHAAAGTHCSSSSSPGWPPRAPPATSCPGRCGPSSRRASISWPPRSGRSSTTRRCSARRTRSAPSSASPRPWARSSASATSTSSPPTVSSTSTASGGASAAPSCARSPTRRSPSASAPSATPASPP